MYSQDTSLCHSHMQLGYPVKVWRDLSLRSVSEEYRTLQHPTQPQ